MAVDDYSPLRQRCPRCGAAEDWPCEPVTTRARYATLLAYHPERGTYLWELRRRGYVQYDLVDVDGDGSAVYRLHLWRGPRQRPVERDGYAVDTGSGDLE